ncbi:MAG: glycosyltransferase [Rhizobiaceae bacterium]|nr:glycosyltransferase [Rhizobiaceae bacterium]
MSRKEDFRLVLIVGMAASIHLARWVALVRGSQYKVVVFPVMRGTPCGELAPYRLVRNRDDIAALAKGEVGVFDLDSVPRNVAETVDNVNAYTWPGHPGFPDDFRPTTAYKLTKCIRDLDPDLVHSMEVQFAGYLMLEAKRRIGRANFPPWLLSNWGSDVLLFQKLRDHLPILKQVFREIDGYWSECGRDVRIARDFDYRGRVFEPMPASGGMLMKEANVSAPSTRQLLLVKGYHGWAGRGLHILSAVYLAAPELRHLRIRVTFSNGVAIRMTQDIRERTGLDIDVEPYVEKHSDALQRLRESRIVVGLGISDGISTTLLEAMTVGTFPVLADTSCACEWIDNGTHGIIVNPHDTAALATALVRAATDNKLVDSAALRNRKEVARRWSASRNAQKVLRNYGIMMDKTRDVPHGTSAREMQV